MFSSRLVSLLLLLFSQGQKVSPYSFENCEVHGILGNRTKVLCYKRNLTEVPTQLPSKLFSLDLSENAITSLGKSGFGSLSSMQVLNVSQNKIHHIEEGAFAHTDKLEVLNLTSNRLPLLSSSMFDGLMNLTTLLLGHNQICRIEPSAFARLEKLKVIDLSSNRLHAMNAIHPVFNVETLEELHIQDNRLQNFSTAEIMSVPVLLRKLNVSHNPISLINVTTPVLQSLLSLDLSFSIPGVSIVWLIQDPCFLKGLQALYLGGMAMKPSDIRNVTKKLTCSLLEVIHLNHLNLTESDGLIEQVCQSHPNVKTLNLQGNRFKTVDARAFEKCTQLRYLYMSFNKLNELPMALFQSLHALQHLSLANNEFTNVPNATSYVTSLESLDLSYNKIHELLQDDFQQLNIKTLCLTGNQISHVFSDLFGALHSLQELNLGVNLLNEITEPFPASLVKLETLMLCQNNLNSLKKGIFKNLTSLRVLNLADNRIATIEPGALEGLSNLHTLVLGSNRITRDTFQEGSFQGPSSLSDLEIFNNYISYESQQMLAKPPFQLLNSLKKLQMNSQRGDGLKHFPVNFLQGLDSIVQIHAGNLAISSLDPKTFNYTPTLQELDLSNNNLASINNNLFCPVPNLKELHLNKNQLTSLSFVTHANLSNLTLLRVTGNRIDIITKEQIRALPSLLFLDSGQNPFTCNCDNQMFVNWSLQNPKTQVLHFYQYTCAFPQAYKGKKLWWTFKTVFCIAHYEFILYITNTTAVLLLMLVCFFYQWRLHMIYTYHLLLAYFIDKRQKRKSRGMEYDYDAFLSYNRHDEKWVINNLLPVLENQYCWKLCLHHRDFEPGRSILENIVDNIYASRKTICIISHHYLESEWCSKEIQVASFRIFDDCKDVLVLIFLEDIPSEYLSPYHRMRKLVKKKTYLKWPQDEQEIPLFWHKLNMAMKSGEGKGGENPILAGFVPDKVP